MSASADVLEMQSLCGEIADRLADSPREKARVAVLVRALGFGANRALEFLRGKARRVDSWEKDHARRKRDALRAAEREREVSRLIANLNRTAAYLRTTDPDGHRHDVAAIERTLALAGVVDRALAETPED